MTPRSPETMAQKICDEMAALPQFATTSQFHAVFKGSMITALRTYGAEMRRQGLSEALDIVQEHQRVWYEAAELIRALIAKEKT